jgi:hypothetical protein
VRTIGPLWQQPSQRKGCPVGRGLGGEEISERGIGDWGVAVWRGGRGDRVPGFSAFGGWAERTREEVGTTEENFWVRRTKLVHPIWIQWWKHV